MSSNRIGSRIASPLFKGGLKVGRGRKSSLTFFALFAAAACLLNTAPALAQCEFLEDAKLTASDGLGGDSFGYSVSVNGTIAVVGAYLDNCMAGND